MKIIAEIGSNHCGSLALALAHIEAAAASGASGVKFQLFRAELLEGRVENHQELARWELPPQWIGELSRAAHRWGVEFVCTPFDVGACAYLRGYVDAVKVSAYDLTYGALVEAAVGLNVGVILSTAMATWEEVAQGVAVVQGRQGLGGAGLTLLQGVAQYPCRLADMNLAVLPEMVRRFGAVAVGISDHTLGAQAAVLSVALGGTMIEKHFKLDDAIVSPDAPHSATPSELTELVCRVQEALAALGSGEKEGPLPGEMELFETCRRTNDKPLRG